MANGTNLDLVEIIDRYFVIKDSAPASIGQYLVIAAINRVVDPVGKSHLQIGFKKIGYRNYFLLIRIYLMPRLIGVNFNFSLPRL